MDHAGMGLGKKEGRIAIITVAGELIEKWVRTTREQLQEHFGARAKSKVPMAASTATTRFL